MFKLARNVKLIVCAVLAMTASFSQAAGFGLVHVQSSLGEPLNLNISVIGTDTSPQWLACIKARVESLDGSIVFVPKIDFRKKNQRPTIQLTTHQNINEPVMNVVLKLGCELSINRTYQILLDPATLAPTVDTAAVERAALRSAANTEKNPIATPDTSNERLDANKVKMREPRQRKNRHPRNKNPAMEARIPTATSEVKTLSNRLRLSLLEDTARTNASSKSAPTPALQKNAPAANTSASKPERTPSEAELNTGDLTYATQMAMIKSLQVEIDALKNENNRIKKKGSTDIAAMESVRSELSSWLVGLGLILLMCLGAVFWLAQRMILLKKAQHHLTWNPSTEPTIYPTPHHPSEEVQEGESQTTPINVVNARARQTPKKVDTQAELKPIFTSPNDDLSEKQQDIKQLQQLYQRKTVIAAKQTAIENTPIKASEMATPTANAETKLGEIHPAKVEEISEVMELVGAWMALHKPTEVLKLLEPFNHIALPDSPLPWLCLLDVYNSMNDQEKYQAIGKRLIALFNVKVVPWEMRTAIGRATLANFPHVVNKILALWDSDEVAPYLASLLVNDRKETRVGFDLAIYRDIERLHVLAKDPSRPRDIDQLRNYKAGTVLFAPPPGLEDNTNDDEFSLPQADSIPNLVTTDVYQSKLPKRAKYVSDYHYGGHYDGFSSDGSLNAMVEVSPAKAPILVDFVFDEPALTISPDNPTKFISNDKTSAFLMDELAADDHPDEEVDDAAAFAHLSPITIKLKLAIAYQDIGDSEGAILLLGEVIDEGSEEEAEQARMMLDLMRDTRQSTMHAKRQ